MYVNKSSLLEFFITITLTKWDENQVIFKNRSDKDRDSSVMRQKRQKGKFAIFDL